MIVLLRAISVSILVALKPLYESRPRRDDDEEAIFFAIPPNRECIETVDMVLHIPIAVDYFYSFL